jgi:outer membrane receptor for ferrienterochelin and colicin
MVSLPLISLSQTIPDEVRISYSALNKPLEIVIKELSDRSGVNISFSSRRIPTQRRVNFNPVTNQPLKSILNVILSRYRLRYEIVGDQIVIMRDSRSRPLRDPVISGYITDSHTGEPLIGANIYTTDKSKGTVTNNYGFYSLQLSSSTYRMQFSYVGYKIERHQYYLGKDTVINMELEPEVLLNDVIITDSRTLPEDEPSASEELITMDELSSFASLGGEADVIRVAGMFPGVSSGPDGLGGINIRGGSSDQNLVLLDGVPVYNASHALGVYSIFNSDIVKSAKIIKGSFPSRYGGRLSSVIDIRTKEGSNKKTGGAASVSTMAAKAYLEGPIGSGGSSFLISGRRTFVDPWIKEVTKYLNEQNGDEGSANYYFYDANAKINLKFNEKTSLMLGGYIGKDDFENSVKSFRSNPNNEVENLDKLNWNWGNKLAYLRLNNQLSKRAYSNFTAYYSDYEFSSFEYDRFLLQDSISQKFNFLSDVFSSRIKDFGIKYDLDYIYNSSNWFKLGVGAISHTFTPSLIQVTEKDEINSSQQDPTQDEIESLVTPANIKGNELYGYIEDEITLGGGIKLNLGVHNSLISTENRSFFNIQPRAAITVQSKKLTFKSGVSKMVQYLHLLSSNGLGLPSDVWLPSTDDLPPEESWIYNASLGFNFNRKMSFTVEGFYKSFDRIISYNEGGTETISKDTDWEATIPLGIGTAYGVELSFNKRAGRTTWYSNYTYSISSREYPDLNNGKEFNFRYDRRHNVKLSFVHRITDNAEFAMNWNVSSGSPFTSPSEITPIRNPDGTVTLVLRYNEKNNKLLPGYQRLDVAFSFFSDFKWGKQKFTIGLYNLLNKKNPFFIDITQDENGSGQFIQERFSVLPIFPSISYSIAF